MKLTIKQLRKLGACADGMAWFAAQDKRELADVVDALIAERQHEWALWTVNALMTAPQRRRWALASARSVEHLSTDPRVKACNDAVEAHLANPTATEDNNLSMVAARASARDAACAAAMDAARASARDAAYAAMDAAWAAMDAAYAAALASLLREGVRIVEDVAR